MAQQEVGEKPLVANAPVPETPAIMGARDKLTLWWTLTMLSVFSVLAAVDRGGLSLLVNPIRADLHINDVEMSFLLGFASTMMTGLLLLPAGQMVDLFSRRKLLFWAGIIWSFMSMLNGIAGNFWMLFIARCGLAGAEATLQPASTSMLRDAVPVERRGVPFAIYYASRNIGMSISLLVSGALIAWSDRGVFHSWPVIGHFKTWQIVLALPAMVTLPLVFLMLTVREPKRGARVETDDAPSFGMAAKYIWANWGLYWPSFAYSLAFTITSGGANWMPTALIRGWNIPATEIAYINGSVGMVTGLAGFFMGGWVLDQLGKRNIGDGPIRVCLIASSIYAVAEVSALHFHTPWMIFACMGIVRFTFGFISAPYYLSVAYVTPSRLMGRMMALQILCLTIPQAFAPTIVALIAQYAFSDRGQLGIIPAANIAFAIGSVIYLAMMMLFAIRIGQFHRLNPRGAA